MATKIGLALPFMQDGRALSYREIRAIALRAEAAGVESLWYPDHFYLSRGAGQLVGLQECWTLLTGLAEATSRVRLGSLVLCQSFRSPGLLAKMAATLQEIAEGRLILGIGAGWYESEYRAFGFPFDRRAGHFAEYVQIVTSLLRNEETTVDGRFHQVDHARLMPPAPPVPVWVASSRDRMNGLTARYAAGWNGAWYGADPTAFASRLGALKAKVTEAGREPSELEYSVGLMAIPVAAEAEIAPTVAAVRSQLPGGASLTDEQVRARVAIGTPGWIRERIDDYAAAGAPVVIVTVAASPFGSWSGEALDRFLSEVCPAR